MDVSVLVKAVHSDFYAGVPDSNLRALGDYLINVYGTDSRHHIIAANEGNAAAAAAGYHLATGKVPVVYMQNSGEGNVINPLASLLNEEVYAIPCIFIIGWRGEPGVHDEPQHIYQGRITCRLLEDMGVPYFILSSDTSCDELNKALSQFKVLLEKGKSAAILARKGALSYEMPLKYQNGNVLKREDVIRHIAAASGSDPVISTTGKASRELYEIREALGQGHEKDFLTVGSMGHASSIALGAALFKPLKTIWCIDGDGALLMHMGALPVIAHHRPKNLIHIVIHNGAHETVGGQPTAMSGLDLFKIAKSCGYPYSVCVSEFESLDRELAEAKRRRDLAFLEVKCALGARSDLGRPADAAVENKRKFMEFIR